MKYPSLLRAAALVIICGAVALPDAARAQAVTVLASTGSITNIGPSSFGSLVQGSDGFLYGISSGGGTAGRGTIFVMTPTGSATVIHNIGDGSAVNTDGTVATEGFYANGSLIQARDGNFYGTTESGGFQNDGTVFKVTPQGAVTVLHYFGSTAVGNSGAATTDGQSPQGGLVQDSAGNFYGTTFSGGTNELGTVFKMTPQGAVTILHSFGDGSAVGLNGSATADGAYPGPGGVVIGSDGNLYGVTTSATGTNVNGTVFRVATSGQTTIIYNSFPNGENAGNSIALVQGPDGDFYSETVASGSLNPYLYKISPQGNVTILHTFGDGSVAFDGFPFAASLLCASDGNFYGVGIGGSINGSYYGGILFKMTPEGQYTILHNFPDGSVANDGSEPDTALIQGSDGRLYGYTGAGGAFGEGTIYAVNLAQSALTSPAAASGLASVPFRYQVIATQDPVGYRATNLPAGLSINSSGVISGTPTSPGTQLVNVTITNYAGVSSTVLVGITIGPAPAPVITSQLIAYGTPGTTFTYTPTALYNPVSYTIDPTALPPGLRYDPGSETITGMPTADAANNTYTVPLMATNATGVNSATVSLVINILSPLSLNAEYGVLYSGPAANTIGIPQSIFQAFDGNFYGLTNVGNSSFGNNAVYEMTEQGAVSIFYNFTSNSDVVLNPSTLIQGSDGNFYGATSTQIFKLTPTGQLSVLHCFSPGAEAPVYPNALIQGQDGNFYGTTTSGGTNGGATIFKMTPQGGVTTLYNFGTTYSYDEGSPNPGMIQGRDGNFYGTTFDGGSTGEGTVWELSAATTGRSTTYTYIVLHVMGTGNYSSPSGGFDGMFIKSGLVQSADGSLYGTTTEGGYAEISEDGNGIVFKLTPGPSGTYTYSIPYAFGTENTASYQAYPSSTPSNPVGGLMQGIDGNIYGTTEDGTSLPNSAYSGFGTIFQLMPNGTANYLHEFDQSDVVGSVPNDGYGPTTPMIQGMDRNFYGIANGVIYTITASQSQVPFHSPVVVGPTSVIQAVDQPASFTPSVLYGLLSSNGPTTALRRKAVTASATPQDSGPTNWLLSQGPTKFTQLPPGESFDYNTGNFSGQPTDTGTYTVGVTPNNGALPPAPTTQITFYVEVAPALVAPSSPLAAATGAYLSYTIETSSPATSYDVTNYPNWLMPDSNTTNLGVVGGTPTQGGNFIFNATAINQFGASTEQIPITVTSPPSAPTLATKNPTMTAVAGTPFFYTIKAVPPAGATCTYYAILPSNLGLTCSSTGTISGTPSTVTQGPVHISIGATNASAYPPVSDQTVLTLTVVPAGLPTITNLPNANSPAVATPGQNFSFAVQTSGLAGTFSATPMGGLSINPASGVVTGTVTGNGPYVIPVSAINSTGTVTEFLTVTVGGSLTVTLTPPEVANDGVQWQVDNLPPHASGTTVSGLTAGTHTITFGSLTGFSQPAPYAIDINPGLNFYSQDYSQAPSLITSPLSINAFTGAFSYQITASNSPTSFSGNDEPPATLKVSATTGLITGTISAPKPPASPQPIYIDITASNSIPGVPQTLEITPLQVTPPVVTTGSVTNLTTQSVTLTGSAIPKGTSLMAFFRYGLNSTCSLGSTTPISIGSAAMSVPLTAPVSGLSPATLYYYQAVVTGLGAQLTTTPKTFTTKAAPIIGATVPTPLLSASSVQVGASINPNGVATTYYFQYGTTTAYTNAPTVSQSAGTGKVALNVYAFLSGLAPNTSYHYRVVVVTAAGSVPGPDEIFTTLPFDTALVAETGTIGVAAGNGSAQFSTFGNPAVNSSDGVAFSAMLQAGTGGITSSTASSIWADGPSGTLTLVAQAGTRAADILTSNYLSFGQPVYNDTDQVAFTGTLSPTGLTSGTAACVWSTSSGSIHLVARAGDPAPGDSKFLTLTAVGLSDVSTILCGTADGIGSSNYTGIWEGTREGVDVVRWLCTGDVVGGETISTFTLGSTFASLGGQTRCFASNNGDLAVMATFSGGASGLVTVINQGEVLAAMTGDMAVGSKPESTFTKFGSPIINTSDHLAFEATLATGATGIWADDSLGQRQLVVETGVAPANFTMVDDPVYNDNNVTAFMGSYKSGTTTTTGIFSNATGSVLPVALVGQQAPGCPIGTKFTLFTSFALPDAGGTAGNGGVAFLATFGGTVVGSTSGTGIWIVDNTGTLQLVARTGDTLLPNETVTGLAFLPASGLPSPATNASQTRSFARNGDLAFLATFGKTQAIFNVVFP